MPIDFARVAGLYREPLARQTDPMIRLFDRLARVLRELHRQVDAADRATRALPLVRFTDGALSVRVVPLSADAPPLPGPPPAAMPGLERICGEAFVAGIAWVGTAVRQELLIPGLVGATLHLVEEIEARTAAVVRLEPKLFSIAPGARHVLETPALLALGVRVAADAGFLKPKPPAVTGQAQPAAAATTISPLLELTETVASMSVALVVALPATTTVVAGRVRILSLAARLNIVQHLVDVEASLLRIHSVFAETMIDLAGTAAIAEFWLKPIELFIRLDLLFVTTWLDSIVHDLIGGLNAFLLGINDAFVIWFVLAEVVIELIDGVTQIDLLAPAAPIFVAAGISPPPSLTIGQLISEAGLSAAKVAVGTLGVQLVEIGGAFILLQAPDDARIFINLGLMLNALAGHHIGMINAPAPPAMAPVPDILGKLLTTDLEKALADWGAAMVVDARNVVVRSLDSGVTAVKGIGAAVDQVAQRTRQGPVGFSIRDAATRADAFVDRTMGDEVRKERAAAEGRAAVNAADPLLEHFLTRGMKSAGDLVPMYVASMRRFLTRRAARTHPPTSPHVLARHGRLAKVRSDRMTIRARHRALDAPLADEVAGAVRNQIGVLYLDGRRRFDDAAKTPTGTRAVAPKPKAGAAAASVRGR